MIIRPSYLTKSRNLKGQTSLCPTIFHTSKLNQLFTCRHCTMSTITGTSGDDDYYSIA